MAEAKLLEPSKRQETVGDPNGLSSDEVHRRLTEFGPNTVSEEVQPRWRAYLANVNKTEAATMPGGVRGLVDGLAGRGYRVISVAFGSADALRLVGVIAISDPPRDDSKQLIATLRQMGVRTVMVTGDSAKTAAAIAREIGIDGEVCAPELVAGEPIHEGCGIFARVVPELKFKLVKALQGIGHVQRNLFSSIVVPANFPIAWPPVVFIDLNQAIQPQLN